MEKREMPISRAVILKSDHGKYENENFHGCIGKYSAEMVAKRSVVRSKQENSREIQCRNGCGTLRCTVETRRFAGNTPQNGRRTPRCAVKTRKPA